MAKMFVAISLLLITNLFPSYCQETPRQRGILMGSVLNAETREVLPGANIVIEGTTLGGASDIEGRFAITGVPPGAYVVRITILGYKPSISSDIVISPSKPAVLDVLLTPSNIDFAEVNVVADYFQKSPDAVLSTQYQSYEEIRQLPGGLEDVVRAVSILPGVAQVQGGRNDLIVRGGAPSENLFLLNDFEIPNINHFGTQGASGGPLSFINLDFVSGTMFSTGGFGVPYGDRLSSVLSIDLREGRTDRFGGKATIGSTQFGLNLEGPVDERSSFIFSARRSYLDFIFKAAGFGFVPEYWDFLAKGDYRIDSRNRISLLGIAVLDQTKFFNDTPDQRYENSQILGNNQDQFAGGTSWQHLFSSGYTLVSAGFHSVKFSFTQQDSLLQRIFSNTSRETESYLTSQVVFRTPALTEFWLGVQGKFVNVEAAIDLPPYTSSFGEVIASNISDLRKAFKGGVYGQVSQQLTNLTITGGGRLDYFSLIEDGLKFSPRISASYKLGIQTSLNASVGRYYQAPSYIWLIANPSNINLTPIGATQFVAGIEHMLREDMKVSLEGYDKRYDHYPVSIVRPYLTMANTGAGFGGAEEGFASFGTDSLVSFGNGESYGVEVLVQKKYSDTPFYGTFSVSFNETRFTSLHGTRRPRSFDQQWILNLGGGYVFSEKWEASAKFRFSSGIPYTPYNADGSQSGDRYNSERTGNNHSLDVRVDRRWFYDSWTLIAYIDIQNIYNRKEVGVPRYDERTGTAKSSDAIGILPSIGVSAEF